MEGVWCPGKVPIKFCALKLAHDILSNIGFYVEYFFADDTTYEFLQMHCSGGLKDRDKEFDLNALLDFANPINDSFGRAGHFEVIH